MPKMFTQACSRGGPSASARERCVTGSSSIGTESARRRPAGRFRMIAQRRGDRLPLVADDVLGQHRRVGVLSPVTVGARKRPCEVSTAYTPGVAAPPM